MKVTVNAIVIAMVTGTAIVMIIIIAVVVVVTQHADALRIAGADIPCSTWPAWTEGSQPTHFVEH